MPLEEQRLQDEVNTLRTQIQRLQFRLTNAEADLKRARYFESKMLQDKYYECQSQPVTPPWIGATDE